MRRRLAVTLVGAAATAAATFVLVAGPAAALAPGTVRSTVPSRTAAGVLSGGGSFKNNATLTATYTVTLQLVRTTTNAAPLCLTNTGCVTAGNVTLLKSVVMSYSVAKGATQTVTPVSLTCPASTVTRYYWTWMKVTDTSGAVVPASAGPLTGKFC